MKLISHRGNINGKKENFENHPDYIINAINLEFDVETDIWLIDNKFYLGHDNPEYQIDYEFINYYQNNIWFHCKNIDSFYQLNKMNISKYFWHQNDDITLTSNGYLWTYPGKKLTDKSIAVLPEFNSYNEKDLKKCYGICSDFILNYK
jgi:hypothetical protein